MKRLLLRSLVLASITLALSSQASLLQAQLYWDSNGVTGGFGNATGTWGTSNFWNTDSTGGAGTFSTTTTSADNVNFGTATLNYAQGTIGVAAGGVTVGSITTGAGQTTAINLGTAGNSVTIHGGITKNNTASAAHFIFNTSPVILANSQTWTNNTPATTATTEVESLRAQAGIDYGANTFTIDGIGVTGFTGGAITGSGDFIKNGTGTVVFNAGTQDNSATFTGNIFLNGGVARYQNANNLGAGNIAINGGILEGRFASNLTRTQGTAAGEIQITGGVSGFSGQGSSASTFNIGSVTWGSSTFNSTVFMLQSATTNLDGKGIFASAIDLNGDDVGATPVSGVVWRTIRSDQSAFNITGGHGTFSGNITNSGTTNLAGLIKTGTGHHYLSGTNTYDGGTQVNQGTLTALSTDALPGWDSSGNLSVAAGATLGVRTGGTWTSANIDTLRGNIAFADNTAALGFDVASGTFTYASNVSGALSVRKYGNGTLQLNGDWSSLGGKLIVESGTISRASGELIVPNIEIRGGTISAVVGGSSAITKTGPGEWLVSNAINTHTGGVNFSEGRLGVTSRLDGAWAGTGTLTIGNGVVFNPGNGTWTVNNDQIWKAGGFQIAGNSTWNNNGNITLEGNVSYTRDGTVGQFVNLYGDITDNGGGYSLTLGAGAGAAGNRYLLAGNNTFSGGITSFGGTLTINSATALGTGTLTLPVTNLDNTTANAITLTTNNAQIWNGNITFLGTRDLNMGTGAVTMNNNITVTVNEPSTPSTFTVGGAIGQSGGNRNLIKAGAGNLVLGGASTYAGTTTVQQGNLIAAANAPSGSAGAFGNATSEIALGVAGGNNAAGILITGGDHTIGRVIRNATSNDTDAGTRVLTLGGNSAHNSVFSGNIFLGTTNQTSKGIEVTAAAGGQVTFSGVIQNPAGQDATEQAAAAALTAVTKVGAGTVVFSNANTYTGATLVNEGTLLVNNTTGSGTGTGAVTVNGGAIGGTGKIDGTLSLLDGSFFHVVDLLDALQVVGSVNIYAGFGVDKLVGINWETIDLDTTYTLIDGTLGTGVFDNLNHNTFASAFEVGFGRKAYFQSGSLQLVVTAIPEPSAALLGALGLLLTLRRRRA